MNEFRDPRPAFGTPRARSQLSFARPFLHELHRGLTRLKLVQDSRYIRLSPGYLTDIVKMYFFRRPRPPQLERDYYYERSIRDTLYLLDFPVVKPYELVSDVDFPCLCFCYYDRRPGSPWRMWVAKRLTCWMS